MTPKQQLLNLARLWREKAKRIEDKHQALAPAQAQVAVMALETCAEEVEEIANQIQ